MDSELMKYSAGWGGEMRANFMAIDQGIIFFEDEMTLVLSYGNDSLERRAKKRVVKKIDLRKIFS